MKSDIKKVKENKKYHIFQFPYKSLEFKFHENQKNLKIKINRNLFKKFFYFNDNKDEKGIIIIKRCIGL